MLYPTETLDLLPPDAQIDAHLKHQMGISRPRAVAKTQKESPRNGLFKPFLGLFVWQAGFIQSWTLGFAFEDCVFYCFEGDFIVVAGIVEDED